MCEFIHLELEDVLELHGAIIGGTAAQAADHLRDRAALEGALGRPAMHAHYEAADLPLQAAVLAHGIAEGEPFIDGNKRTALVSMLTFLEVNGVRVEATDPSSRIGSSASAPARRPRIWRSASVDPSPTE